MLETIRIRRLGYPLRFPFSEFLFRYRMIAAVKDPAHILAKVKLASDSSPWQIGKTKIFLKDLQVEGTQVAAICINPWAFSLVQRLGKGT